MQKFYMAGGLTFSLIFLFFIAFSLGTQDSYAQSSQKGTCVILPNQQSAVESLGQGVVEQAHSVCDASVETCGACVELCRLFKKINDKFDCPLDGADGFCNPDFEPTDPDCIPIVPENQDCIDFGVATCIVNDGNDGCARCNANGETNCVNPSSADNLLRCGTVSDGTRCVHTRLVEGSTSPGVVVRSGPFALNNSITPTDFCDASDDSVCISSPCLTD